MATEADDEEDGMKTDPALDEEEIDEDFIRCRVVVVVVEDEHEEGGEEKSKME